MNDPRVAALAKILVHYSVAAQPGDLVTLRATPFSAQAVPLFDELVREVLAAGAHPHLVLAPDNFEGIDHTFYTHASDDQLKHVNPLSLHAVSHFQCDICVVCATNTRRLSKIDPGRISMRSAAHAELVKVWWQRTGRRELRRVLTLYPTAGYAQDAQMSLREFEDFVFASTYADSPDPFSQWKAISLRQERLIGLLANHRHVKVTGPYVDLTFSIEGRTFANYDGKNNMPDGEVFTAPVEDSVEGWIQSTVPANYAGVDVGRVRLAFKEGLLVDAKAEKNEAHLRAMLATDPGASRLGEFGVGTNEAIRQPVGHMLFDEKIAGTIHVALGSGYPETDSKNESAIHWDFLCDMTDEGEILLDGQRIYEHGRFIL